MENWRKFRNLSGFERGIVIKAAAGLVATCVGLRLMGFRGWRAVLVWLTPATIDLAGATEPARVDDIDFARRIARLEQAAARRLFFPRANCLEQSLTLWWLLKRRGIAAELHAGARKEDGRFEAHAWVECDGVVLNDAGDGHRHFVAFDGRANLMEMQTP